MLKDPKSRVSLVLPPILQCLIFGYAATYDLNNVPYAVVDQDRSAALSALLARLDGSGIFTRVATLDQAAQAAAYVDDRRAVLIIVIDRDFQRNLLAGRRRRPGHRRRPQLQHGRHGARLRERDRHRVRRGMARWRTGFPVPDPGDTRAWYNPSLETRWNMIPGADRHDHA